MIESYKLVSIVNMIIITIIVIIIIVIVIIIVNRMMPGMCTRPLMVAHVEAVTTVIMLFSNNVREKTKKNYPLCSLVLRLPKCGKNPLQALLHSCQVDQIQFKIVKWLIRFNKFKMVKCINAYKGRWQKNKTKLG